MLDYISQTRNQPLVDSRRFNFSYSPGGSLSVGSNTFTMPLPTPQGLAVGFVLRISGGTGAAENVTITAWNPSTGQISVTCANTHSGAWTIGSATSGVQEALNTLPAKGGIVTVPVGVNSVYTTILIGNGNSTTPSTINSVQLMGMGRGPQSGMVAASCLLFWQGAANGTLINIQGPIGGVQIRNLGLDGNGQASHAIVNNHGFDGLYCDLNIESFNDYAYQLLSYFPAPIADGANSNEFRDMAIIGAVPGSCGIQIGNLTATTGVGCSKNTFINIDISVQGTGVLGGYADNIHFFGVNIAAGVTGIKVQSPVAGFPGRWDGHGVYIGAPTPIDDGGWNLAWGNGMGFFPYNDDGQTMNEPLGTNGWAYGWETATGQWFGAWGGTPGYFQSITSSNPIANTTTPTDFSINEPIQDFYIARVGLKIRIVAWGHYSTTGTPTITININFAGVTIAVAVITAPNNASNQPWQASGELVIRSLGVTGSMALGPSLFSLGPVAGAAITGAAPTAYIATVNTTVPQAAVINVQWGAASSSNTITMDGLSVDLINVGRKQ